MPQDGNLSTYAHNQKPSREVKYKFHSCTMYSDAIESFIYPTDAQLDCSKNVKIYIKIYMRGAATCFGFLQPSSGSYYVCLAKVIIINNQLKYVFTESVRSSGCIIYSVLIGVCVCVYHVCVCVCVCVCVVHCAE